MLIFRDFIKKDEFMSDIFKYELKYDDVIMKVQTHYTKKEEVGNIDIGRGDAFGKGEEDDGPGGDEPAEKVIDVVYNSNLQPVHMSKKEFMAYVKEYFKKIVAFLEENGKKDRIDTFKKGATDFIKFIVPHYDEIELYTGASHNDEDDLEGGIVIQYWEDESASAPVLYLFNDALTEEKC